MRIPAIHWVGVLLLGGFILLSPLTVASLDYSSAPCQNSEGCLGKFLEQLTRSVGNPEGPTDSAAFFKKFVSTFDDTTLVQRATLRYAHWLKDSSPLKAIPLLQTSLEDYPVLGDYITFWLGEAYSNAGLEQQAADAFQGIYAQYSNSLIRTKGLYAAGKILTELGDCESALPVWSQALDLKSDHPSAPEAWFHMGVCAEKLGQREKAIEFFRELWWKFPMTSESMQAEKWLRQEMGSLFLPSLSERYNRGIALYDGGNLEEAVQEFQRYLSLSAPTPKFFQVQYKLAMTFIRLKRYEQAEAMLSNLSRSSSSQTNDAWVWLGRVYLRQNKGQELEDLVNTLAPNQQLNGDQQSLLNTFHGIWLEDHSRWLEAAKAFKRGADVAQSLNQRLDALWRVGWIHYQQDQFTGAVDMFQEIIQAVGIPTSEFSLHALSQALYWLGRSQEHLGQLDLAKQRMKDLSRTYPFTYYGQLAENRIGPTEFSMKPWTILASNTTVDGMIPPYLQQDIHYQKIQVLRDLQLFKEAVQELEDIFTRYGTDSQAFSPLISLASDVGAYDVGIRLAIRHFGETLRKGQLPLSSPAWVGAFPIGYQRVIQAFVPKQVDPFLVAGLIREESLYSARVISPVGAIGLMQLMPATAQKVARQLGLRASEKDSHDLYDPEYNIQLGTFYLGQLLKEFQDNIIYSVAAYNAGPQAVKRWIAQNGQRDPDEFVELIGYRETRSYVKRVVGSYRIYRLLFGEVCRGVSLDRFC